MGKEEAVIKTQGIIEAADSIRAGGLPFRKGQKVELIVWAVPATSRRPSKAEIKRRLDAIDALLKWNRTNLPKDMPPLSAGALDRGAIYEDRCWPS